MTPHTLPTTPFGCINTALPNNVDTIMAVAKKTPAKKPAATNFDRYGAVQKYLSPTKKEIKALRETVPELLQHHAAALVRSNLSTYGKWETGTVAMHPGLWELFQIKIAQLHAGEIPHPANERVSQVPKKVVVKIQ